MTKQVIGFITVRNRFKMQGLVNISGFHVDPTFKGRLRFAVQNVGSTDIRLRYDTPTFTIFFSRVDGNVGDARDEEKEGLRLEDVQLLGGGSITLSQMKKDIDRLQMMTWIYGPFVVAAFISLLVLVFTALTGK